jgi:integrase
MRLEEVCQLHQEDIKQVDGVYVIDVNDHDDKRLKTIASKRLVPIHPNLIDMGFLDFIKSRPKGHLWIHLKKGRDGYGRNLGSWFNKLIRKIGVANPKVSFHSFRHTFSNQLKQSDVQEERIAELLGHSNESVTTGRYGKKYDMKSQLDVINTIHIPLATNN